MKAKIVGSRSLLVLFAFLIFGGEISAQMITEGKVVFERRTNLEKRFKGQEMNRWMRGDLKKPKIDRFELYFNDTASFFLPLEDDIPDEREWSTMKNATYQNFNQGIRKQEFSFWGTKLLLEDSLHTREWRMTESKRTIAGYECRQAVWQANDSTRIYAWYADELVASTGPETFNGLPGVILGLANEDGSVVYFAKEVKVQKVNIQPLIPVGKKKDWYNEETLRELIADRFTSWGSAVPRLINDLFLW